MNRNMKIFIISVFDQQAMRKLNTNAMLMIEAIFYIKSQNVSQNHLHFQLTYY